jgi:glucokinase
MKVFAGVDLGGTNIKAGLVDVETGDLLISDSVPTQSHLGPESVLTRIAELVEKLISQSGLGGHEIGGLGISAPGIIDLATNTTVFMTNLHSRWRQIPVGDWMMEALGYKVAMLNDVRAITYGEWKFGAGKGVDSLVCMAVGTGVGGGLVVNDQLVLGYEGTAGEIGHQTMDPDGPLCGCGNHGCLEVYASGPAIAAEAARGILQGWSTKMSDLIEHDFNRLTPKIIAQAADLGDEFALEIWQRAGRYLGIGVANILTAIGVKRVIIAGGVANAGNLLLNPIKDEIHKRVFLMPVDKVDVVRGKLGSKAGIIGIATWRAKQDLDQTIKKRIEN